MKITQEWLEKRNACSNGMAFVTKRELIGLNDVAFIKALTDAEKFNWAVWTLVRRLKRKSRLQFAVFCAKDVLPIYEAKYPTNLVPRKAIEAAERCLESDTPTNRGLAVNAANAAWGVAYVAAARVAAMAAVDAAAYAAWSAADALPDPKDAYRRYIAYGLELLKDRK